MPQRVRKLIGLTGLVVYLLTYVFAAAALGGLFQNKPWWAQIAYFAVAGMIWVLPLKPLFTWMNKPDTRQT
jgi:membrane protein implicated in regulation of membrane protease activity